MISAGVEGRLHYMTYPEPWRGPPKQPPEFLRPAPKPLPPASRYNGVNNIVPNGTRLAPQQRPPSKYSSPPAVAPVNLAQHKEDVPEEIPYSPYSRLFTHQPTPFGHFAASPYASLYQSPYTPILRPNFVPPPPLSPLETYSPTTPTPSTASTFLSPPSTFSPPSAVKPGQSVLIRDKRPPPPPPPSQQQLQQQQQQQQQQAAFKVPSGKEGSLKHRILTRPEDTNARIPLDLQKPGDAATKVISENPRKRLTATQSPPRSPKKSLNNNTVPGNFAKGSLIQLATGELRRVEDMRTEDFILSADHSPELRLADSTVVRIEENPITGSATITLSYNQRRTQVEIETTLEHPFFVYGQGWASCSPDRTLQCYGLKVHRLQVGDILISLTPREPNAGPPPRTSTIITTATTTAMTVRQVSTGGISHIVPNPPHIGNDQQHNSQCLSPDSLASRKRRWSAPDQICDENEQILRKQHRVE